MPRDKRRRAHSRISVSRLWLSEPSWLAFLYVTRDPEDPAQVARVDELMLVALYPYPTARGRRELDEAKPTSEEYP